MVSVKMRQGSKSLREKKKRAQEISKKVSVHKTLRKKTHIRTKQVRKCFPPLLFFLIVFFSFFFFFLWRCNASHLMFSFIFQDIPLKLAVNCTFKRWMSIYETDGKEKKEK